MESKIVFLPLVLSLTSQFCLDARKLSIEKSEVDRLVITDNSTRRRLPRNVMGRGCSTSITISSDGPTCQVQGSVLGTYIMTSTMVMRWPTWQMRSDRFVYRCPCANKRDWIFGRSNGNNVGWIKHRNCTGCPESCSQDWMYWDDNVNKWYYDKKIRISTDASLKTCPSKTSCANKLSAIEAIKLLAIITLAMVFCALIFAICCFLLWGGCMEFGCSNINNNGGTTGEGRRSFGATRINKVWVSSDGEYGRRNGRGYGDGGRSRGYGSSGGDGGGFGGGSGDGGGGGGGDGGGGGCGGGGGDGGGGGCGGGGGDGGGGGGG